MLKRVFVLLAGLAALVLASAPAAAQQADMSTFATGPVFEDFGPHAPVEVTAPLPEDVHFAIAFDVAERAKDGARNRGFESAARFINMHVANGVPAENIKIAVVVHGGAVLDLLTAEQREKRELAPNGSAEMVRALLDHGVRIIVCGQSAAAQDVTPLALIDGVEMELSAMTAHALLQQDGYTVNPF